MAAAPMPDPSQPQPEAAAPQAAPGAAPPQGGAPSGAPAPPELMVLAQVQTGLKQMAQQYPATSTGLAKAIAGINEAMSAVAVSQPQQQAPSQSPPY